MTFDPKSILPQEHPYVQLNNKIEAAFGGSRVVIIGVHNRKGDIFNQETLSKIKNITDDVKRIPGIKEDNVVSISDRKIRYVVGTEDEIKITPLMDGGVPTTPEGLAELRKRVFSNDLFLNSLVSKDGTAAAIIVDFAEKVPLETDEEGKGGTAAAQDAPSREEKKAEGEPPKKDWEKWQGGGGSACTWQSAEPGGWLNDSFIHCQLQDIAAKYRDIDHSIYLGGMPIVISYFMDDAFNMLFFLFPLAILIIGVIHYLAFKTWQGLVIPLATSLMAVVWAMGLMGLSGAALDPWNAMTPILVLAIAAGDSVQILKRYYEELERLSGLHPSAAGSQASGKARPKKIPRTDLAWSISREAVIESTTETGAAMLTTGLITAVGFASLMVYKLETFQSFGLFTAFGILSAIVLEMTLIPALRSILRPTRPKRSSTGPDLLDRFLTGLAAQINGKGRGKIMAAAAIFFVVSIYGTLKVEVSNSNRSQFFETTTLRQDERALNEKFAGTSTFYILLESKKEDALKNPDLLRAVDLLQRQFERLPEVGKTESYVDYVKQMNQTVSGGDPTSNRIPDTQAEVAQFLFLYSVSGNPADFARLMRPQQQEAVVWVFLKSDETGLAESLIRMVDGFRADFDRLDVSMGVAGSSPVVVALNQEMVHGKTLNIMQVAVVTFLITAIVRRSLIGGLFVMIPIMLSVLINFGVMGLTGVTLGIGTATISAMAVGIGADYEIYLIFRMREEFRKRGNIEEAIRVTLQTSGKAIIFVAFAVAAGYGMLAFTGLYLHMEGILVPLAMLTSCLGALAILPALVIIFKPKFVFGEQEFPLALKQTAK